MQRDRLTLSLTRLAIALLLLLGAAGFAEARPKQLLLQSEERFRIQIGNRAVPIAEGVYQVDLPSGERMIQSYACTDGFRSIYRDGATQ